MSNFKDFKKKSVSSINDLIKRLDESETKKNYKDDRFWRCTTDKAGNGWAVIRFLPSKGVDGEDNPAVEVFSHSFQGPGGWYIENSLRTIGEKDPMKEANDILWAGSEDDKNIARQRRQKKEYISNILVIKDEANPENEGKVFLFKYGVKIFDKIKEKLKPEFGDTEPINPFDFYEGANFKLKIRKVAGYTNYEKSEFDSISKLFGGDDAKLEQIWNKLYPLKPFIDPANFKSYNDLKDRLDKVLGGDYTKDPSILRRTAGTTVRTAEDVEEEDFRPSKGATPPKSKAKAEEMVEEETDALSFFKNMKDS